MRTQRREHRKLALMVKVTMAGLFGLVVRQELSKPTGQRTWQGTLFGWLPYDFRRPSLQRIRDTLWAPDNPKVVVPRVYGIGWDLNLGRLVALLRRRCGRS